MTTPTAAPSNVKLISDYFFPDRPQGYATEMKALTPEDKQQLGNALRDGTLNY